MSLVCREIVVLRRWGSAKQKYDIKQVEKGQMEKIKTCVAFLWRDRFTVGIWLINLCHWFFFYKEENK